MRYILLFIPILFVGCCCKPVTPSEPIIITKIVEKEVPVKCNIPTPAKPIYIDLNDAQKLYVHFGYTKKLEAALTSCQKDINNSK